MPGEHALILDPKSLAVVGIIDESYTDFEYTRRWRAVDTFQLTINREKLNASELRKGRLIYAPEDEIPFLIETVETDRGGTNDDIVVSGRSVEGIAFDGRLVVPPRGRAHDVYGRKRRVKVEAAMKYYVRKHAVRPKPAKRRIPHLVIAANQGRGKKVRGWGRYQPVLDMLIDLGTEAPMGWEVTMDLAAGQYVFDVIPGTDRRTSVFFDFAWETLEEWRETVSDVERRTVAYVGGQGKGKRRLVKAVWFKAQPKHFERREAFVEAQDVPRRKVKRLRKRGKKFLRQNRSETSIDATIHQFGSFQYRTHWDLGDIVLVGNRERNVSYTTRIEEVKVTPSSVEVSVDA